MYNSKCTVNVYLVDSSSQNVYNESVAFMLERSIDCTQYCRLEYHTLSSLIINGPLSIWQWHIGGKLCYYTRHLKRCSVSF